MAEKTRNERRREAYAAQAGRTKSQKRAALKAKRATRPPRARLHPQVPCGNPACGRCYGWHEWGE